MSVTSLPARLRGAVVAPRPPATTGYLLATIAVLLVAAAQVLLFASSAPWFLYTPAAVLFTLRLGGRAGVWATLLSALAAGAVVARPGEPLLLAPVHWGASIIWTVMTLGLVGLVVALRAALLESDVLRAARDRELAAGAEREAFLAGVLSSSTDCIKVLDLDGRLTFMSEGGQRVMEVSDFNAIAGCPWPDFWQAAGNAEARAAVAAARAGDARSFIGRASTMAGTPKWWHVAVSPIRAIDGQPDRILSVSRDITALREREEERDRFVRLAENSGDFVGMARTDGRLFFLNDAARRMVGLEDEDITRVALIDLFPPDQVPRVTEEVLPAVERSGFWSGELSFRHLGTGALLPVLYSAFPITDAGGTLVGYGTVTRDNRERKRAEEQMQLLNGELAHRLKNVLAVVQSVALQTLRNAADTDTAGRDLSARLAALGSATDVLTGAGWRSADLRELASRALAPHGELGRRILIDGPAVTLRPELAVAMGLALHELATNAAKYGALSNELGQVLLSWFVEGDGPEAIFVLHWAERGGPAVSPPTRRGFGSTLIERSLRAYFRGEAATDYWPDGLVFNLKARLADAAVTTGN